MRFLSNLFESKTHRAIRESITSTSDSIARSETVANSICDYRAICSLVDTTLSQEHWNKSLDIILEVVSRDYAEHLSEIKYYIDWKSGSYSLDPRIAHSLRIRHYQQLQTLSLQEAATLLLQHVAKASNSTWPKFLEQVEKDFGDTFVMPNADWAQIEFILAVLSYELEAVRNFEGTSKSQELAAEIEKQLFEKGGSKPVKGLQIFRDAAKAIEKEEDLIVRQSCGVPGTLIRLILGPNVDSHITIADDGFEIVGIYLATQIENALVSSIGNWRYIAKDFKISA